MSAQTLPRQFKFWIPKECEVGLWRLPVRSTLSRVYCCKGALDSIGC